MPYNDLRSDVFSNPPELRKFETLEPSILGRVNEINLATANLVKLESRYSDVSPVVESSNPIIEQIKQSNSSSSVDVARNSLYNAYEYGEAA